MNNAVILHDIEDARHCVNNKLYSGAMLFSTHTSVDVYLKEICGLECQCLSKFIDQKEMVSVRTEISQIVDRVLGQTERYVSSIINTRMDLNMRYFVALYSYLGKYQLCTYVYLENVLKKIIRKYKFSKIYAYDCKFNNFFKTDTDLGYFILKFFNDVDVQFIRYHKNADHKAIDLKILLIKFGKLFNIEKMYSYARNRIAEIRFKFLLAKKKTILLADPLYDLKFLKTKLNKYNVLYCKNITNKIFRIPEDLEFSKFVKELIVSFDYVKFEENEIFEKIFLKDIKADFFCNLNCYINSLTLFKKRTEKQSIALGIWGSPPIEKTKALFFEYLRSKRIKILGAQHGCIYGDSFEPWHFDSDFNRCDYFISYGFTREDLRRLYANMNSNVSILPFGMARSVEVPHLKKNFDILFPITNNLSMLAEGMARISPDKLIERQIKLLEYLNTLKGVDICVKLFMNSTDTNCSVLPILKRLKNLTVIDDITLTGFLKYNNPKSVLIECPSQPLYDVLQLDTEIFLMNDFIHPFEEKALEELKKRVYYAENIEDTISNLDLFLAGKLEKKRDNVFFNHYVHKENTRENILNFIDKII